MRKPLVHLVLYALVYAVVWAIWTAPFGLAAQDTLSAQVLRLLDRANTWTAAQIFSLDIQVSTVNTAAPASALCDAAGEVGKIYYDSTNDLLYLCSGASGWRKVVTEAP